MTISRINLNYLLAILSFGFIVLSCVYEKYNSTEDHADDLTIKLRWVKSFPEEEREDVIIGLKWELSFLGAMLPVGSMEKAIEWEEGDHLKLDLSKVGFNVNAENVLKKILLTLKDSEEYKTFGALDLGRFIVLTLNSSNHYHAITGAERSLQEVQKKYSFYSKPFAVTSSSIAYGDRLIQVSEANAWHEIAFIATEGVGEIDQATFVPKEHEMMVLMPNGQLRFALYDLAGSLKTSASPDLTRAGKPAKCLWCHEISILPPFEPNAPVDNHLTAEQFMIEVSGMNTIIKNFRSTLDSDLDFTKAREHTKAELIYIGFMEPSVYRLAQEWNLPVNEVENKLHNFATHEHDEFPFFGKHLFLRKDIDEYAPYNVIRVPDDAREQSEYEPDLIIAGSQK